jgi:hypothetical protein
MTFTAAGLKTINDWADFWRYQVGVNVIPANTQEKKTSIPWKQFQNGPVSEVQYKQWKKDDAYRDGMAIVVGKVWHRPDRQNLYLTFIDFDKQRGIDEVLTREDGLTLSLQQAAEKWIIEQHKGNMHKAHAYFYSPIPFPNKGPDDILGIEIKGLGEHGIAFCTPSIHRDQTPYEIIDTMEPQILTELAARQLIQHLNQVCLKHGLQYLEKVSNLSDEIRRILKTLHIDPRVRISQGQRHNTLVPLADSLLFNHLGKESEEKLRSFFEEINNTLCDPGPLSGSELENIWRSALGFVTKIHGLEKEGFETEGEIEDEDDELRGIDINIIQKLSLHVYSVVSSNPPVIYVAHKGKRKIIKAVVKFVTETTTTTGSDNQKQEQKIIKQLLLWKQQLIFAVPVKVIINDSPIDENKTYQVTFIGKLKKPITIGSGSINYIIEELASKGKVLRKAEAVDALTATINRYEELGLAEVNESVTQVGYYYIKGKFETHEITQVLDKEPDPDQVLECIGLLDELSTKWRNKDIFPTVIKWAVLAPFNYIFKANDKWLRNIHGYGWASSGKTSLGKVALAAWRLHKNALRKDYQLRFSNIDSTARFGSVISRSTYPKVINEVGGLQDKFNRSLLDLIKGAIEAPYVRGKFFEGRYQNIPSLCNMFLTSNSKPPDDSGYRSRNILIQHTKDDVHERGQKEAVEFEKWLDSNLNILGVLGDFIARYVIVKPVKPEESFLFHSGKSYEDMAKEILGEFYESVGKDKPEWLDRVFEQRSIVEENTEWAYFEVRGFLMDHITEAYSRHIRTLYKEQDPGVVIDFKTRLNFCIKNKLLPFLNSHTRKDNTEEIVITHDILKELTKKLDHIEGITTLEDLGKEIPGFEYCQRRLGPDNRNTKVLAGKQVDFAKFLEGKIEDDT